MARINPKATPKAMQFYSELLNPKNSLNIRKSKADNSLTYGQVERRRKRLRKANFKSNVCYRKASDKL